MEDDTLNICDGYAVLQALGLATVRHFSQLVPLLLEWLAATDAETRLLAAQVLIPAPGPLSNTVSSGESASICKHVASRCLLD